MTATVSAASIVCMAVSCLTGLAIPLVLFLYLRKKKNADVLPFFVGCGVMLLFAFILESAFHRIVLGTFTGTVIQNNPWLYAIYGGLAAGLFEETGRLLAFKTVLRKNLGKNVNALMYGAGHGGIEAVVLLSLTMVNNLILSIMMNTGSISLITGSLSGEALAQTEAALEALATTPASLFLVGALERLIAVTLQIALSVLVWFAAKNRKQWFLYPAAILIHFVVDAAAVLLSSYQAPVFLIEGVTLVLTLLTVLFAKKVWEMNPEEPEEDILPEEI